MRPFALARHFSRWNHAVRHNLAASDAETIDLATLLTLASPEDRARWEGQRFGYTEPRGAAWLRARIAERLYASVGADDLVCFAGAGEGIYAALHALLTAEDHAVVVVPGYQSAETVVSRLCATSFVTLDAASDWSLDIDAVARAMRRNTRFVAINFPNNPTGKILEPERFAALVALCRRQGAWLFSDEVYRLIERDPARRLPAAVDVYERGISLGVLSKSFGLPGLRLGWIACRDAAALSAMEDVKHYLSLCNAAPAEALGHIAVGAAERLLERNRAIAAGNLALLDRFFREREALFDWHTPDGGSIGYPRYKGADGVERFTERLIEEAGVLLLPASVYRSEFYGTPPDRFRIGFGRADMATGLVALERHLGW